MSLFFSYIYGNDLIMLNNDFNYDKIDYKWRSNEKISR